jgi:SAM-dependent methyltransferase
VDYEEVWRRLKTDWNVDLSPEVRASNAPVSEATLVRCLICGLDRFEPLAPGDRAFYAELMAAMPYNHDRWEFGLVRREIRRSDDVLDVGCGEGHFLKSLGARGGRTVGVDSNSVALSRLAGSKIETSSGDLEEFAARERGAYDVVACFHTLEHVADPMHLIRSAVRCLRRRGRLFVSVPNRNRRLREEGEPLDRPPHHVTRWAAPQLEWLGNLAGVRLESVRFEPPDQSVVRADTRSRTEASLHRVPAGARSLAARVVGKASVGRVRHRRRVLGGTYERRGFYGHSMLATYRLG